MTEFETNLLYDIAERESALFEIERTLFTKRYRLSRKHLEIFSVQSIPMIYSIWEGFIQVTFQNYIEEINTLDIDFADYCNSLKIFHMENTFKQLQDYPIKSNKKILFYEKLSNFYKSPRVMLYDKFNAKSNVDFKVLNDILNYFNLKPFNEHWKTYTYPKPSLKETMETFLKYRNGVAHGGDISAEEKVTQSVFVNYKNLINDLMYGVHGRVMEGLIEKKYLR